MSIGENIRRFRETQGITQENLAKAISVSQTMICQIERGSKIPSMILGVKIAEALNCSVNDLYESA